MKHKIGLSLFAASTLLLGGCATTAPAGGVFTNISLPVATTSASNPGTKVGTATCNSYLLMFAVGDCSVETAKKNGGITEVTHADWEANNILGLIGNYKLTVYGK